MDRSARSLRPRRDRSATSEADAGNERAADAAAGSISPRPRRSTSGNGPERPGATGRALSTNVREDLQAHLGHDFTGVRVHADGDAARSADTHVLGPTRSARQPGHLRQRVAQLKELIDGGPLTGRAALEWDMQVLAEEQILIQPMYDRMAPETRSQLEYIARKKRFAGVGAWWTDEDKVPAGRGRNSGTVPPFTGSSLLNIRERWEYGMGLSDMFTPGGTGYRAGTAVRPPVGVGTSFVFRTSVR